MYVARIPYPHGALAAHMLDTPPQSTTHSHTPIVRPCTPPSARPAVTPDPPHHHHDPPTHAPPHVFALSRHGPWAS
jgi:hypothetical protein